MRKVIAIAVMAIVGLTGCCKTSDCERSAPQPTFTKTVTITQTPIQPEPVKPEFDLNFGETYKFGHEGLAFAVSKPKPVTVANPKGQRYSKFIEFTVKMANTDNTEWRIEQTLLNVSADGNHSQDYSANYPQSLAPGKNVTFKVILGVDDIPSHTVSVEIMPDFVAPITWG